MDIEADSAKPAGEELEEAPRPKKKRALRCVDHPDVRARDTCRRCGDYRCEACFGDERSELCLRCVPHRLPWKRERSMASFARTVVLLMGARGLRALGDDVGSEREEGGDTFARHIGSFSALAAMLPLVLVARDGIFVCLGALVVPAAGRTAQAWALLDGWVYHQVARLLGGATFRESSISAAYYASAARLPATVIGLVVGLLVVSADVPELLLAPIVVVLGGLLWHVALVRAHGMGQHGLSSVRATIAAASPLVVSGAIAAALWGTLATVAADLFRFDLRAAFGG